MRAAMQHRRLVLLPLGLLIATSWSACAGPQPTSESPRTPPPVPAATPTASDRDPPDAAVEAAVPDAGQPGGDAAAASAQTPCPPDMAHVVHDFCPKVERKCVKKEKNVPNKITLCHKFQPGSTKCLEQRHHLDFCIDKYEYPNRQGAHPPWMVSWYDAESTCRSLGKRTCWDWEWMAACEGPEETPFPYGWERDNTKCNIDNLWIDPRLKLMYNKDKDIALKELSRLDQSVPSGSMPGCVSPFGVFDLTGNMDEWVTRTKRNDKEKSEWAGLKGGAWGHVRNACRPMTTSHPPDFTYYFITFRCCKDLPGAQPFVPPGAKPPPEQQPADKAPIPVPVNPPGPSTKKVAPENDGN